MTTKVYQKSHFKCAEDLYKQANAFYGSDIVNIIDNESEVILLLKD